ncbi:xanthine phosphoribosyltransferase [Methyloferula stellata]|uniref:xanthine phosphoribosyltransferase n=1 Tax=Methyloferula stellata TaxID=876270 RepID=UPI00036D298E
MLMASDQPAKNTLTISWDQFHRDARALAALLRAAGPFSSLVAVTRGGLTPAAIVARELDLRCIETISVASYVAETVQGDGRVVKEIAPAFIAAAVGAKVLVIDDLADTGETLKLVRQILPSAHVATLYVKPAGKPLVDTFVTEVPQETWIYFPWDLGLRFEPPLVDGH